MRTDAHGATHVASRQRRARSQPSAASRGIRPFGDGGHEGVHQRLDARTGERSRMEMKPGRRRTVDKAGRLMRSSVRRERITAGIRAKVEHPFRLIKRQSGYAKVRYRGLRRNTGQLMTLFTLSDLWVACGKLTAIRV
ncbi:transposase [Burkholderia sp. GS2Y]|uniref:Transposase n=1 Tax=Burkholderia theae TaxID=3143496 RepID=A0ABU9WUN7_9BURK